MQLQDSRGKLQFVMGEGFPNHYHQEMLQSSESEVTNSESARVWNESWNEFKNSYTYNP